MVWQLQVDGNRSLPYEHIYPLSLKPPSHSGCHTMLSRVPWAVQQVLPLLVICFKYSSVYLSIFKVLINFVTVLLCYNVLFSFGG